MKKSTTRIVTVISLSALLFGVVIFPPQASAVTATPATTTNNSGQALEIGPPVLNLSGDPGAVVKATISVRDVSPVSLLVTAQINDFVAGGEDGTPKIILDNNVSPYSFKTWITPLTPLTLKTREIRSVPVTITIPKDASPGGYYEVVRFTGTPPNLDGTGVSLSASVGTLILLTVNGQAKENLTVAEFSASHNGTKGSLFEAVPVIFTERLKNNGNIQEQPGGLVTVKDMFGNVIATLPVNQPPHDILPSSIRKFESSLDSTNIGNRFMFGLYHADMSVQYGANKQTVTASLTFWVIPYTLIAIIIAGLIAAFFLLRTAIRRYNKYILAQARKNNK